jgi:hypothetical protein
MELTDKQRAQAYREFAIEMQTIDEDRTVELLLEKAGALDPPSPKPGTVVWWRMKGGDEWHIGLVRTGNYVVDEEGVEIEMRRPLEWHPVPIPDPDGYCVKDGKLHKLVRVQSAEEWGEGARYAWFRFVKTSLPGERDWGRAAFMTREDVERKEQEYGL